MKSDRWLRYFPVSCVPRLPVPETTLSFQETCVNYILQQDTLSRRSLASIIQAAEVRQIATLADGSSFAI